MSTGLATPGTAQWRRLLVGREGEKRDKYSGQVTTTLGSRGGWGLQRSERARYSGGQGVVSLNYGFFCRGFGDDTKPTKGEQSLTTLCYS
jgi:hypothetical protein